MISKDAEHYIVNASGMRLQGYAADANGNLLDGLVTDLQISASSLSAQASTSLEFVANFKADVSVPTAPFDPSDVTSYNFSYSSALYDSQGNEHTLTQYLIKTGDNTWVCYYQVDGQNVQLTDANGNLLTDINGNPVTGQTIMFNADGSLASSP